MLSEEQRHIWERIGVAATCDAMELLDMRRAVIHGLRAITPGAVAAGTACTIRQLPKHGSATRKERLVRHRNVSHEIAQPGDVVVMDTSGYLGSASWGETHSRSCMARGVAGFVSNGCVRDVSRIREVGFATFCAAASPIKSQWDLETASINEPIQLSGVQVRPGDIVVADEDGVVIVPIEVGERVQEEALKVAEAEGR
jgi:4-hydroxy-4-methyl-2-oxoglutarate aldolase